MDRSETTKPAAFGNTLAWGLFLAVSWTWCIGMYLPNLLARDGGLPFFLAFFVPNVLGAASVGFVLRTRQRSASFVRALRVPMLVFSAVTVLFQAYFLAWKMTTDLHDGFLHLPAGIASGATLVGVVALLRSRIDWVPALATIACSVAAGVLLVSHPRPFDASEPLVALAGLSMVTALGFGICPYLDLSFNRAVQHATKPPLAFAVGFFVFFAATILLVTRGRMIWSPNTPPFRVSIDWVLGAMGLHYGAQASFTVLAHTAAVCALREGGAIRGNDLPVNTGAEARPTKVTSVREPGRASLRLWIFLPALVGVLLGAGVAFAPRVDLPGFVSSLESGEFGYRLILGSYGLLFPVWTLMALRRPTATDRATLLWTLGVCALAGPFLWVGAIGRNEVWLIPGVSLILVAAAVRFTLRSPSDLDQADA